jgi:glucose/arabinose dehydrogenase
MKKIIIILLVAAVIAVYLFLSDFSLVKKLVGYNIPEFKELKTVTDSDDSLSFLDIPDGFNISIVAKDLENPRVIIFDPKGRMLVSETKAGRVSILDPSTKLGAGDSFENKRVLIEGLKSPHGLDFYKDPKTGKTYLYIAETHQVARYPYDINTGKLVNVTVEHITKLPAEGGHFTRTIAFGPNFRTSQIISGLKDINTQVDTKLYISVGSSCDVCEESTWKRAAILESDPEGTYTAEFAGGLRNSVFFAFHPFTKEIWATEMGRDNLGDNLPPDEINIVKVAGPEHKYGARRYGWPFCYGNKVQDKKFNPDKWERIDVTNDCSQTEPPVIEIQAHSAPLGLAFVPDRLTTSQLATSDGRGTSDVRSGNRWSKEWEGDLLVAHHGSWNRSEPTGYKVVRYNLDKNGKILSKEPLDFITGWISRDKKNIYGRPVDLKFGPDSALYISDDAAGLIYRVNPTD